MDLPSMRCNVTIRRSFLSLLAAVLFAGCSGENATGPSASGTLLFKRDALTCTGGTANITFFIDGSSVGSEDIAAGGISKPFRVTAGSHTAGARLTNIDYTWPTSTVTVPGAGSFTLVLTC